MSASKPTPPITTPPAGVTYDEVPRPALRVPDRCIVLSKTQTWG